MNTWSKVEELMDFVKTHDIKDLKDYWNRKEEEKKRKEEEERNKDIDIGSAFPDWKQMGTET